MLFRSPNVRIRSKAVATNHPPHGAFRGFGAPQSIFALERHMDRIAKVVGLTPEELRRRNFVKPSQMPYTTAMGEKYDSGDFDLFLTKTLEAADWNGFAARKADTTSPAVSPRAATRAGSSMFGSPPSTASVSTGSTS